MTKTPVLDALAADRDRVAFLDGRGEVAAGEALDLVYRVARTLLDGGLGPGGTAVLLGPVSTRLYLVSHAVELLGAAQLDVPVALSAGERARLVAESGATAVVADPDAVGADALRAAADLPGVRLWALAPSETGEDLFTVCRGHSALPFGSLARPGDPRAITLTSGTTGRSKAVVRRFRSAPGSNASWLARLLAGADGPVRTLLTDRLVGPIRALGDATVITGGRVSSLADCEPDSLRGAVRDHGITHTAIPATYLRPLLDHPATADADLSSLRCVVTGGGPVSPALLGRATARLGPVVHCSYGQTEAGHIAWLAPEDYADADPEVMRSCGRPVTGVQVEVRGPDGRALGVDERGRVWVRTPLLMDEYLGRPEETARVLRDGWLDTGDVGRLGEGGLLTLLGRASAAVVIGGETVFTAEVDALLQEHPHVLDAASFDVPGEGGATLHAAVVAAPGAEPAESELRELVLGRLGPNHAPSSVMSVPRIPQTPAYKVCRETLRSWHASPPAPAG
ncbi:AMP-binding protein [Nocardiopsis sp. NPDC101807]|uniref:AMP-binding protein n=1 Tax=Nocardiopsis sp. NPDC101807 TaxID=3364339 RepID=UPI0037FA9EE1